MFFFFSLIFLLLISLLVLRKLVSKISGNRWVLSYIRSDRKRKSTLKGSGAPIEVYVTLCDHYQPFWGHVSQEIAEFRVATLCREYPRVARQHTDSQGHHPIHTFFYSEEDYNPRFMDSLSKLSRESFGDVELLIAHQNDTSANFKRRIEEFRDVLYLHHNLLRKDSTGKVRYGFIHGYWALNNSRPDQKMCGINNEIPILHETGCFADFTYPSAPDPTQPSIINSIYFSPDTPGKPRAHHHGYPAAKDVWSKQDLLLIQGPLGINWNQRHFGILPSLENGRISHAYPFSPCRANFWIENGIHISNFPNHLFIKLHTHGCIDQTIRYFFAEHGLENMWSYLEQNYNDGEHYRLHYVSAWKMFTIIKDLCLGTQVTRNHEKAA